MDNKLSESLEDFSIGELYKVFRSLVEAQRRPQFIFQKISYLTFKKDNSLSPKHITAFLKAMNQINYFDEALLDKLTSDFISQIENIDSNITLIHFMIHLSKMRYKNSKVIGSLIEFINKSNIEDQTLLMIFFSKLANVANNENLDLEN